MRHLLIVEDDPMIRTALRCVLQVRGHEVVEAENGAEALDVLKNMLPDKPCMIVLDLMMPVMDGETFRLNQLDDPVLADIPVVIASGKPSPTDTLDHLRPYRVLRKPYEPSTLLAAIQEQC